MVWSLSISVLLNIFYVILKNSLARIVNTSHDGVVPHDIRFYVSIPSMKALCTARHMKFCKRAAYINNDVIRTKLFALQNENISMCNDVKVDIDCTYVAFFYLAVNLCYS